MSRSKATSQLGVASTRKIAHTRRYKRERMDSSDQPTVSRKRRLFLTLFFLLLAFLFLLRRRIVAPSGTAVSVFFLARAGEKLGGRRDRFQILLRPFLFWTRLAFGRRFRPGCRFGSGARLSLRGLFGTRLSLCRIFLRHFILGSVNAGQKEQPFHFRSARNVSAEAKAFSGIALITAASNSATLAGLNASSNEASRRHASCNEATPRTSALFFR